ncbi:hypothetical protein N7509_005495 [Penicillium cosmopolitanum]|uniref:Uncharacterized protein n=1 Tax=Penicillium cosmopolitanum TaxID=1131564 RepID=A0A9X0BA54_9EURO|nr:uncharacterized protein N7509_005495 [Penicillium cosmopolitanum]KAJ5397382.1 hypothetical protein N7509_005495 [Penicillium cosmopolitanum]
MTPHATPVTPESDASAPPANAGSPSPEAHQPHMNLSSTPSRSRFRAWDLNSPPRFVIWEDSPQRGSQICPTGHVFESIRSDDKENVYTTVMDYDTEPESESQTVGTDEMRLPAGPRDVLGMPITSIFGPTLLQHSQGTDATPSAQPTPVENNARLTMQVALREEDEMDMEWNDGPSPHEGEELARVNDTINRGAEQRWQYERGSPVRDHNVQRQRRHFLEVRRTAHSRRHQDRRRRFTGAGSPR